MNKNHLIMAVIGMVSGVGVWALTTFVERRMRRKQQQGGQRVGLFGRVEQRDDYGLDDDYRAENGGFSRRNRILTGVGVGSTL